MGGTRLVHALLLTGWCGCLSAPPAPGDAGAGIDGDGASPAVDGGEARCGEIFGGAPDYKLCGMVEGGCEFFTDYEGTCADLCATFGAECLRSYDSDSQAPCEHEPNQENCQTSHESQVCVCAFPPGA